MADANTGTNTMLGVVLGAIIVILVGGGILYATGMIGGPKTATVNVSAPNTAAPAPAPQANAPEHRDRQRYDNNRHDGNDRRDDRRPGGDRDRR